MEACNQKRALKAMAEAEERFKANDLDGAIRIVQRAHALCPSLPRLSNLAIVFRILSIASGHLQAKNSASFWHAILGSKPSDSIEAIKHQYRKMCLHTHPDKNQSLATAADGAFKLVAQAWEALSTVRAKKANSSTGGPKKASPSKGSSSRRGQQKAQEKKSSSSCSESGFRVYVSSGKAQIFSEVKPDGSYRVTVHL